MMTTIKIEQLTPGITGIVGWLEAKTIEILWARSSLYFAGPWRGGRGGWFDFDDEDAPILMLPRAELSYMHCALPLLPLQGVLEIGNGRHRTRWLIQHGAKEVPMLFPVDKTTETGISKNLIRTYKNRASFDLSCPAIYPQ